MKALILAAGLGLRLAPITDNYPKALVKIHGKSIVINQIECLITNGITDITVISGYKAEMLEKAIHSVFPEVKIIESVDYATTNNMYSAFLGKKAVCGDDFLMMNADVFFDCSVISALMSSKDKDAIVVDIGNYNEESMKVSCTAGKIVAISKEIKKSDALGTSIDVYRFSAESGRKFFDKCAEYILKKDVKKWSEVALNDILSTCNFKPCKLVGRWYEVDNFADLNTAEALFKD